MLDIDLEKFFDRVEPDILMSRLARRIRDKRLLQLIRRYLKTEMVKGRRKVAKEMPHGGPLSLLLLHILLDELNKALEHREFFLSLC
ncbi:MAG: reverse transcriptase domain-containing protein [Sodalis sp. (in: enterobacteria)]